MFILILKKGYEPQIVLHEAGNENSVSAVEIITNLFNFSKKCQF